MRSTSGPNTFFALNVTNDPAGISLKNTHDVRLPSQSDLNVEKGTVSLVGTVDYTETTERCNVWIGTNENLLNNGIN